MSTATHVLGDTAALTGRSLRHILRSPDTIITTAIMPIAFLLLFGYVDRFRSLPIARSSVLWAHVLTSVVSIGVSLVVVTAVALATGFRSSAGPLAWLGVAGILLLFTLALTWVAVIAGLAARTVDGASAFSYPLIFLPFVSSAFVPTESMPGPLRWFAQNQPVTSIVNSIRELLAGQGVDSGLWVALAWCLGILVLVWPIATRMYRRRTR